MSETKYPMGDAGQAEEFSPDASMVLQDAPSGRPLSYQDLEVWRLAREATIEIHQMSRRLPAFEMYETGSQIRRSVKSIRSNIVEGFGRRRYKQEFIRYLVYAHASCDETADHLLTLKDCGSLTDEDVFQRMSELLDKLGRKLSSFTRAVEAAHLSEK